MNAKRMIWFGAPAFLVWLAALPAGALAQACTADRATGTTIDAKPFSTGAYGMSWNLAADRIAYMAPGSNGYYRVYTMKPDGSDVRAITEGVPGLPTKHQGAPIWHPSGKYVLIEAEKQEWRDTRMFGSPDYGALPGFGMHDDMWLIAADGSKAWRLTNEPMGKQQGILLPVFSPDGRRIAWSERQPDKTYVIQVADFSLTPEPHLGPARSYTPGGKQYYEPGSFSSDGKSLLYTSDQDTHNFWLSQIYRLDFATGRSTRLTFGITYNEHPVVVPTPTGDWVVYMSSQGSHRRPMRLTLGTDWFAVRLDGSGGKRLTSMNTLDRSNPEFSSEPMVACRITMGPDPTYFLGDIQDSLVRQTGLVKVVHFTCK